MLSTEKQLVIFVPKGDTKEGENKSVTLYGDLQDPSKYYYLPSDHVKIAGNGKRIEYVSYIEDGSDNIGGYLTLEVELGPTEKELELVKSGLTSRFGGEIKLSPIPFKDGNVKLVMFGSEGKDADSASKIWIAGSVKPSLFGRQVAVFSMKLGKDESQIVYNLLKQKSQTQMAVMYDLSFLGVMPAHHLKITVDFSSVENWSNHLINAKLDLSGNKWSVLAEADIDLMFRELVSKGDVVIENIDYTSDGRGRILGEDDPTAMKLVKELMSPTLFDFVPLPKEESNNIKDASSELKNKIEELAGEKEKETPKNLEAENKESQSVSVDKVEDESEDSSNSYTKEEADEFNSKLSGAISIYEEDKDSKSKYTKKEAKEYNSKLPGAVKGGDVNPDTNKKYTDREADKHNAKLDKAVKEGDKKRYTEEKVKTHNASLPGAVKEGDKKEPSSDSNKETPAETSKVDSIAFNVGVNVGYSYKKRKNEENVKRTYLFNKQQAVVCDYHPSGILSISGTEFDYDNQVKVVKLGDGVFRDVTVGFRSGIDFSEYGVKEIIINSKRKREDGGGKLEDNMQIVLDKNKPSDRIRFFSANYGTEGYELEYSVDFIFEPDRIIGSENNSKVVSFTGKTLEREIVIGWECLEPLKPLEVLMGNIEGFKQVIVTLLRQNKTGMFICAETILLKPTDSSKKYLINGGDNYKYSVEYIFDKQEYDEVRCSKKKLEISSSDFESSQIIVNNPLKGIIYVSTCYEGGDFPEDIVAVRVYISQGGRITSVNLNNSIKSVNAIIDFNNDEKEKYEVSAEVIRRGDNGTLDTQILDNKFLTFDESTLIINF